MGDPEETRNEQSADNRSPDETSKKTLEDIEEEQKDSGAGPDDHPSSPSPDGQFNETHGERDDAGPM
jgi:hypothetical protein